MKVISFWNHCGGTGKSTSAAWVAKYLARNLDVLLVDCDPQGVCTSVHAKVLPQLGKLNEAIRGKKTLNQVAQFSEELGCNVVAADESLTESIAWMDSQKMPNGYMASAVNKARADVVILDIGTAADQMAINALIASDYVIIPCYPGEEAKNGAKTVISAVRDVKPLNAVFGRDVSILGCIITKIELRDGAPWIIAERKAIGEIRALLPVLGMTPLARGQDADVKLKCAYASIAKQIAEVLK